MNHRKVSRAKQFAGLLLIAATSLTGRLHAGLFYAGVSPTNTWWPGGIIPYEFDTNYHAITPAEQVVYLDVLREFELAANIHLVPRTNQANYLRLQYDPSLGGNGSFCLCNPSTILISSLARASVHEMGHALGFDHEHVRPDRDAFVVINWTNIVPASTNLFVIVTNGTSYGPYDIESTMHYRPGNFSIDPGNLAVLQPTPPYFDKYIYRIAGPCLSVGDRAAAAYLYGPPTTPLTNVVTNTKDSGFGTLRAALYYANDHPGTTVRFNIPTNDPGCSNGVWTIKPSGDLPPLVGDGTVVDGSTQPGFVDHPVVVLDGSGLIPEVTGSNQTFAGSSSGLFVYQAGCTIKGLAFNRFLDHGIAVETASATNNQIQGCYIGVDATGTNAAPIRLIGVGVFRDARNTLIGGTNASQRNVISANGDANIYITGTNTTGTRISGNYLGPDATGSRAFTNGAIGIHIFGGPGIVTIGGTNAGTRNLISGNGRDGITLDGTVNSVISGNYIGTDAAGTHALPNGITGLQIFGGGNNLTIGGNNAGAGNLISGNLGIGLILNGVSNSVVQGNFVGTDVTGSLCISNDTGVEIFNGSHDLVLGGSNSVTRNVISGNIGDGIILEGGSQIIIHGNYLGTDSTGNGAVSNGVVGLEITSGAHDLTIRSNVLSGNGLIGLILNGTRQSSIAGNCIGANASGNAAIPNGVYGIQIFNDSSGLAIGGTTTAARNIISGNGFGGIQMGNATNNIISGNFIGTDKTGSIGLANGGDGISFGSAAQNTIGGVTPGAGNLISGNVGAGISIGGAGASNNVITGNFIGTRADGLSALANSGLGVLLYGGAKANTIGGPAGARNLISGNAGGGLYLINPGTAGNAIQGNYIGSDSTGNNALGNGIDGVSFYDGAASNLLGGASAGAGNVIVAAQFRGVIVGNSSGNLFQGNSIGVAANGVTPLGNGGQGIYVYGGSSNNVIGLKTDGSGAGNRIAFSVNNGVHVDDTNAVGNTIRGNLIYSNGGLGIDLAGPSWYGVTPNDPGDPDLGPNRLQNFPLVTNAASSSVSTTIKGTFNSRPNRTFLLDVYASTNANPSGYGEGQIFLGDTSAATDGSGNAAFTVNTTGGLAGLYITATATDVMAGDTSEFGPATLAAAGPEPTIFFGPRTWSNNSFSFSLTLVTNQNYRIQTATNIAAHPVAWTDLTNFTATASPLRFTDRTVTNAQIRFYRVVTP